MSEVKTEKILQGYEALAVFLGLVTVGLEIVKMGEGEKCNLHIS